MKNQSQFLLLFALLFIITSVAAQETAVEANSLSVTCNKTTHLIFPFAIKSIDRGSPDVLAQKAPGSDNVLQLKAAKAGFAETNVTVITADNKLYPFKVTYSLQPKQLTISFVNDTGATNFHNGFYYLTGTDVNNTEKDIASLQNTIRQVAGEKKSMFSIHTHHGRMRLLLKGLYVKNDVFYFQFLLSNFSNIRFDIQSIAFILKDAKKAKRRAVQEQVLQSLLTNEKDSSVMGHSGQVWVVALPKFTLEDGKYLSIQVMEENGGRNLALKVFNRHLLRAKPL